MGLRHTRLEDWHGRSSWQTAATIATVLFGDLPCQRPRPPGRDRHARRIIDGNKAIPQSEIAMAQLPLSGVEACLFDAHGTLFDFASATRACQDIPRDTAVLHGGGGGKAIALKQAMVGSAVVARFVIGITQKLPPDATVEEIELNGAPGLVAKVDGRTVVAIMIDTDGERICSIFAISNPDKLDAIGRN
jgi:hypothetical protein